MEFLDMITMCIVILLVPMVRCRPSSIVGLRRERRAVLISKLETKLTFVKSLAKENKNHLEDLSTSEEVCVDNIPYADKTTHQILSLGVMKLRAVVKYTDDKTLVTPDLHKRMRQTKHDVEESLNLLNQLYGTRSLVVGSGFSIRSKSNGCGTINVVKFCIRIHEDIIRAIDLMLTTL